MFVGIYKYLENAHSSLEALVYMKYKNITFILILSIKVMLQLRSNYTNCCILSFLHQDLPGIMHIFLSHFIWRLKHLNTFFGVADKRSPFFNSVKIKFLCVLITSSTCVYHTKK